MTLEIITEEDLEDCRIKLLDDIKSIIDNKGPEPENLLKISPGTLPNLKVNRLRPFSKVGGIICYKYEDIVKILNGTRKI